MRRAAPLVVALAAVAAVVVPYLALGGASYEPTPVADPCRAREWRSAGETEQVVEQVVLAGLDGIACNLGVPREELVLAFADEQSLEAFADEHGLSRFEAERALRDGVLRALDEAEDAGAITRNVADVVRGALQLVPARLLLDALDQLRALLRG